MSVLLQTWIDSTLALALGAGCCQDPVTVHFVLMQHLLEVVVSRNYQNRSGQRYAAVDKPVFIQLVNGLQIRQGNDLFFLAAAELQPFVARLWRGLQVHNKINWNVYICCDPVKPLSEDSIVHFWHISTSVEILHKYVLGTEQGPLHHPDWTTYWSLVSVQHGELDVGLKREAPALRVLVHQSQRVVSTDIPPFRNRLCEDLYVAGFAEILETCRFPTGDVTLYTDLVHKIYYFEVG